jgi:uncharacterized protein YacL
MVGVSLALMGLVGLTDADSMAVYDSQAAVRAIAWAHLSTLSAWFGFLTSGAVFGWCLVLSHCLEVHHIHPEDYDSARAWFNAYLIFFNIFPIILGLSYIALAIGTASVVSLKVLPGVPTTLQVIFAFTALLIFLIFVAFAIWRKSQVINLLYELRKEELEHEAEDRAAQGEQHEVAPQSRATNS